MRLDAAIADLNVRLAALTDELGTVGNNVSRKVLLEAKVLTHQQVLEHLLKARDKCWIGINVKWNDPEWGDLCGKVFSQFSDFVVANTPNGEQHYVRIAEIEADV
jgi:hypothetical protein